MPFEVSIKITAQSQLEAVKAAEAAVERFSAANRQAGADAARAAQGSSQLAKANEQVLTSARPLRTAIGFVAAQAGALGPTANLASNAITAMAVQSGPAGIAIGVLAATMGLLAFRIQQTRDRFSELSEIELRGIARETGALGAEQEIRGRMRLLEAEGDKIRELGVQMDALRVQAEKAGVPRERVDALVSGAIARALREEISAMSRMDAVTATNTLLRKQNALAAAEQAEASDSVISGLRQEIVVAEERIKQIDRAERLAHGGGTARGVAFVEQAEKIGKEVSEISKAAAGPFGTIDVIGLDRLNQELRNLGETAQREFGLFIPPELQSKIASLSSAIQQLADKANFKLTPDYSEVLKAQDEINNLRAQIKEAETVAAGFKLPSIDTTSQQAEIDALAKKLAALRAQAAQPIVINTIAQTTGSPTLPFSEYFGSYAPGVLKEFADKAGGLGLNFDTNITQGIVATLGEITAAEEDLAGARGMKGPTFIGDFEAAPGARLRALREQLDFLTQFAVRGAAQAGGAGPSGGNTFVIDLRGATISQELLDRQLIPRFEGVVRMATGKEVGYRVLN